MPDSNDATLTTLFNRRPDDAIRYLQDKKPQAQIDYLEVKGRAHDHAFVIAKMTDMDMTAKVQQSLVDAMDKNLDFDEWQASIEPYLKEKGWWGRQEMIMPDGTVKKVQLGSDHRLKTIYDTNVNQAYHKAREHKGDYDIYPYAMWLSRGDVRTRPSHAALDSSIFRRDDPYYQSIKPRKAWRCRCDEILLTAEQAGRYERNEALTIYEDLSDKVTTETVTLQGTSGAYSAPVNILRLADMPAYRTDPGWIHADDALPMQPMLDRATQVPAILGANSMQAVLARESVVERFNADVSKWVDSIDVSATRGEYRHVGALRPELIQKLIDDKGVELDSAIVTLHDRVSLQGISNSAGRDWMANAVKNMTGKHSLYWDNVVDKPLLVFDTADDNYKLVVAMAEKSKGPDSLGLSGYTGNVIVGAEIQSLDMISDLERFTRLITVE